MFDCLDLVPFLMGELEDLPEAQARCVAELAATDEDVRLLFVVGTTEGSDPNGPEGFAEELARLDSYVATCA